MILPSPSFFLPFHSISKFFLYNPSLPPTILNFPISLQSLNLSVTSYCFLFIFIFTLPMMNQDLGLSLTLSLHDPHQLNLMPSSQKPASWPQMFTSLDRSQEGCRSLLKGIDVNRSPETVIDCEEEAGVSSPNSTISSVSGKRSSSDIAIGDEQDAERNSDEDDGDASRKKLRLSKDQSVILEQTFKEHNTLNPKQKLALAKRLGLRPRQVEVWFQNRRARTKLKQTEVDCEFLKRCCDNLTDENRRLQKEVQELRALKMSPQFYMQMAPPTTLTLCPSCDRDPRHNRSVPFNPWTAANNQMSFDVLGPRS